MPNSHVTASPSDIDFIIGPWLVRHRRLNARLCGCTEWCEFEGRMTMQKILGGFGNVEDNVLSFPEGDVQRRCFPLVQSGHAELRDLVAGRARAPCAGGPYHWPLRRNGGLFFAEDTFEGRPIQMRFTWRVNPGANPTWEQSFSDAGSLTWETNWTTEFERRES